MKKQIFSLLLFFLFTIFYSQKRIINDFSEDYFVEITPNKDMHLLKLFANKQKKPIFSLDVTLSDYDFESLESNVIETPYGHQSIVIFDDFNFDGKEDIAVKYGNESCYGGPSYEVYLYQNGTFKHSAEFSALGQMYCGFFEIDDEKKQIHTMTKSGCCWHQFSEFVVKNNKPVPIKIVEQKYEGDYLVNKIEEWKNGKHTVRIENQLLIDDLQDNIVLKAVLENGKTLYLLKSNGDYLFYYFTDNDLIELMYSDKFFYSKSDNAVQFTNDDATYKIFNDRIEIDYKNKIKTAKFAKEGRLGNVSDVYQTFKEKALENLEIVD